MFSQYQILINPKSYGHQACARCLCQENMCLLYVVSRCMDLKVQLITTVSAVLSQIIYQECAARSMREAECMRKVQKQHYACALKIASEQRTTAFRPGISWSVAELFSETAK